MTANEAREYAERYVIIGDYWDMCGNSVGETVDAIHAAESDLINDNYDYIIEWLEEIHEDDPTEDDWFNNEVNELLELLKQERA